MCREALTFIAGAIGTLLLIGMIAVVLTVIVGGVAAWYMRKGKNDG